MATQRRTLSFAHVTRLTVITGLSLLAAAGAACARDLPLEGRIGIEAVPFRADCPTGFYLVGINGRSGGWVDAIQTVCAPWYVEAGVFGNKVYGIHFGGQGGGETSAVCPFHSAVGSWGVEVMSKGKRYVEEIQVMCRAAAGRKLHVAMAQFGGANDNPYDGIRSYRCPEGELATGLHGRAGQYIEAIGLICGPEPILLEGPTTTTPESSAPPPDNDRAIVSNRDGLADVVRKPNVAIVTDRPGTGVADVARKPNLDIVTERPGVIPRDGFTGTWATVTSSGRYTMNLTQTGDGVKGSYTSAHGGITGTIDGHIRPRTVLRYGVRIRFGVLVYRWTEGGSAGSGTFTLAADGNSFAGWWNSGADPDVAQNSWNGTRQ